MEKRSIISDLTQEFSCPIYKEVIDFAVISEDGFTYDKVALEQWMKNSNISPMLGSPLKSSTVYENKSLNFMRGQLSFFNTGKAHFSSVGRKEKKSLDIYTLPSELKETIASLLKNYFSLSKPLSELYAELDSLIEKYPKAMQLYVEYANILRFGNNAKKALEMLKRIEEIHPEASIPKYVCARIVSVNGQPHIGKQRIEEALAASSILDHPLLDIRYLTTAFLNTRSKEFALDFISAYLDVCPADVRAQLNQVFILFTLQKHDCVLKYAKKFLHDNGYDACVEYYLARTLVNKGKKEKAFMHLEKILATSKEPIFLSQCLYDRALNRDRETELPLIIEELLKAHELFAAINADINLAEIYLKKSDYADATKWVNTYGDRVNKEADINYLRVSAGIKEGLEQNEEAIQMYLKLIELDGINSGYYTARIQMLLEVYDVE